MQNKFFLKVSLAVLVASLSGLSMAADTSGIELYGKAFVTVQNSEIGAASETELVSNASRFGFKGGSSIDHGLKVIYQAEYEIAIDDGNAVFGQRNIFVGLSGNFGTVLGGKHDTPTKMTQNKIDLFNDLSGDIKGLVAAENRANNAVMYKSPDFGGVKITVASILAENPFSDTGTSVSATYTKNQLYVAFALDNNVGSSQAQDTTRDTIRLVGQYTLNDFTFGALVQNSELSNVAAAQSETGVIASVAYQMNKFTFKGQLGVSDELVAGGDQISLGVDYKLGSKTKALAFLTSRGASDAADENKYIGFGLEHNF